MRRKVADGYYACILAPNGADEMNEQVAHMARYVFLEKSNIC